MKDFLQLIALMLAYVVIISACAFGGGVLAVYALISLSIESEVILWVDTILNGLFIYAFLGKPFLDFIFNLVFFGLDKTRWVKSTYSQTVKDVFFNVYNIIGIALFLYLLYLGVAIVLYAMTIYAFFQSIVIIFKYLKQKKSRLD